MLHHFGKRRIIITEIAINWYRQEIISNNNMIMSYNNNNKNLDALIQWKDGKHTTYDTNELRHLRKVVGGMGFLYFNPHNDRYEQVRAIQVIPGSLRERIQTRSAAISERKKSRHEVPEKLPAHLRLHRIYAL